MSKFIYLCGQIAGPEGCDHTRAQLGDLSRDLHPATAVMPQPAWDECPGCRAGIKHLHCHNPWTDDGGGG